MSALPALPCILADAAAVAATDLPIARPKPIDGLAFYRKHTVGLLRRYLQTSMEIGRSPCVLGNMVFRGRMSSYRLRSFEDGVIFIFDVEKCLKQLDPLSRKILTHIALEDYTAPEAARLTGESERSVQRIYGEALGRLTRIFLTYGVLEDPEEMLSRGGE